MWWCLDYLLLILLTLKDVVLPVIIVNTFVSKLEKKVDLCFIIVFICDLFVSRDDLLMS